MLQVFKARNFRFGISDQGCISIIAMKIGFFDYDYDLMLLCVFYFAVFTDKFSSNSSEVERGEFLPGKKYISFDFPANSIERASQIYPMKFALLYQANHNLA